MRSRTRNFSKISLYLHVSVTVYICALTYFLWYLLSHNLLFVIGTLSSLVLLHARVQSKLNGKTLKFLITLMTKMGIVKSILEGVSRKSSLLHCVSCLFWVMGV